VLDPQGLSYLVEEGLYRERSVMLLQLLLGRRYNLTNYVSSYRARHPRDGIGKSRMLEEFFDRWEGSQFCNSLFLHMLVTENAGTVTGDLLDQ
jgi:hypothetical protein